VVVGATAQLAGAPDELGLLGALVGRGVVPGQVDGRIAVGGGDRVPVVVELGDDEPAQFEAGATGGPIGGRLDRPTDRRRVPPGAGAAKRQQRSPGRTGRGTGEGAVVGASERDGAVVVGGGGPTGAVDHAVVAGAQRQEVGERGGSAGTEAADVVPVDPGDRSVAAREPAAHVAHEHGVAQRTLREAHVGALVEDSSVGQEDA